MAASPGPLVPSLMSIICFTLAGLAMLTYDIVLTFHQEWKLIWSRPTLSLPRVAYLVNRYGTVLALIFYLMDCQVFNPLPRQQCVNSIIILCVFNIVSLALANGLVLLKISALWDNKRRPAVILIVGFMVTYSLSVVFMVRSLAGKVRFDEAHQLCLISGINPRNLTAVYAPMVGFDVFTMVLFWMNALHRPRGLDVKLVKILWQDGLPFFAAIWCARLSGLLVSAVGPIAYVLAMLYLSWAVVTTTVSRLLLSFYEAEEGVDQQALYYEYADESTPSTATDFQLTSADSSK